MTDLRIAKDLSLPIDAVTQKIAWLGRTGSGKTYGCKRMVEQMLRAGAQVIVLDPVGVWPGLRLGPKSFDVPVLGGLFGDIPLEPTAGALIADLAVNHGTSLVIDVSQMLDAERTRFAQAFGERFFQLKKATPGAVHVVLEECQEFVPQNPQPGEQRMLHEWQRNTKLGRNFGIGISFVSQRPQEVNKKALNQAECVFAFQLTGPQERKALQYWLSDRGADERLADVLPTLKVGSPHVWSPQWLKVSKVVSILPIDSLDTSQTPKVGNKSFKHRKLEPIDLKALTVEMAATIERAKADDPKALRARLAALELQLETGPFPTAEIVEVPVLDERAIQGIHALNQSVTDFARAVGELTGKVDGWTPRAPSPLADMPRKPVAETPRERLASTATPSRPSAGSPTLGKGEFALLTAIAQHRDGVTREQLTVLTGYKRSSRDTYLQRLKSAGLITDDDRRLAETKAGRAALGPDFKPLPTGAALRRHWLERLPQGERAILQVVVDRYPKVVHRDEITKATNYLRSSRDTYLQRLRSRELIDVTSGGVKAS